MSIIKFVDYKSPYSQAVLFSISKSFIQNIGRDEALFTPFGYGNEKVEALEALSEEFSSFKPDRFLFNTVRQKAETKNGAKVDLIGGMEYMYDYIRLSEGVKQIDTLSYRPDLSSLKDAEIEGQAKALVKYIDESPALLLGAGLQQDSIEGLKAKYHAYSDALADVVNAKKARTKAAQQRRELGNRLYSELCYVGHLGRFLLVNDPAGASHYLMPKRTKHKARKPLEGSPPTGGNHTADCPLLNGDS